MRSFIFLFGFVSLLATGQHPLQAGTMYFSNQLFGGQFGTINTSTGAGTVLGVSGLRCDVGTRVRQRRRHDVG